MIQQGDSPPEQLCPKPRRIPHLRRQRKNLNPPPWEQGEGPVEDRMLRELEAVDD